MANLILKVCDKLSVVKSVTLTVRVKEGKSENP